MIPLYSGSGSQEIQVLGETLPDQAWAATRSSVVRLLEARKGGRQAAELLASIPFELRNGTNGFNDEFSILYYKCPVDRYVELAETHERDNLKHGILPDRRGRERGWVLCPVHRPRFRSGIWPGTSGDSCLNDP